MLIKRLFMFGYESPAEADQNARHGWDDESSAGVWIVSQSDDDALNWGRVVAERFVCWLFADKDDYSWADAGFAHWIESDPTALAAASELPVVTVGEMPDFEALSGER
ncbi:MULTISPECIES: hypothetical protein [Sphingomonas]|uniref:hypothetical protein n=1 Tax=Sphingomonas TaxID=13687 RepID=UPI000833E531|nr:hypothetical protein [Sphingomonas sp. CCH10-B3]